MRITLAANHLAKRIVTRFAATNQPDGQITCGAENLSSPRLENFPLFLRGKSVAFKRRPAPQEGRLAIVTKRGAGCGGRW
jgi:hypothetical protein